MKVLLASCLLALFGTCMLVQAAPAPRPARGMKRIAAMEPRDVVAAERIRRAQYNPRQIRDPYQERRQNKNGASPRPQTQTCSYNGPQRNTSDCSVTSEGCATDNYQVERTELQLEGGRTFQSGGHVNFQYIPLRQYRGFGSYADPDPNWTPVRGGLGFDPKIESAAKFIGRSDFVWLAGADLPAEGYCIIRAEVNGVKPVYGEGGEGPVCYCPLSKRI